MSPVQRKVVDFVAAYTARNRIAPTLREIADHLGLASKGGAHAHVERLIDQGHLIRTSDGTRNIAVPDFDLAEVPSEVLRAELQRRETAHG